MKARLFKDSDNIIKILCNDGTIAEANEVNLSKLLREFVFIEQLTGEIGRWDDESPNMFIYKKTQPTYAYVTDEKSLVIDNFAPFSILFETTVMHLDDFITVNEYAAYVGKSVEQVKVYLREGKIPNARKVGRDWVIHRSSIYKYPQDKRITTGQHTNRKAR